MKVRAVDIRDLLQRHGTERGIIKAMEMICEEQAGLRQTVADAVKLLDQVIDQLTMMSAINGTLVAQVNKLKRDSDDSKIDPTVGAGSGTH
jgi:hypothetical protein